VEGDENNFPAQITCLNEKKTKKRYASSPRHAKEIRGSKRLGWYGANEECTDTAVRVTPYGRSPPRLGKGRQRRSEASEQGSKKGGRQEWGT